MESSRVSLDPPLQLKGEGGVPERGFRLKEPKAPELVLCFDGLAGTGCGNEKEITQK